VKPLGLKMLACWIAFSEPLSETTWLENARLLDRIFRVAKVMPLGLKMLACWIAFSEPLSETTWLENARLLDRIFRVAK
jgi:hypothetical protein